jgi:4-hydroxy-2-oxoheptanedioate aldolase
MARLAIEGVCLDLQHGTIDYAEAAPMIAAINAAGRPALVRCLWNDPGLVGQALDAGASAVIAPMVNTRAEAEGLVRAAKYQPLGSRSWGGYTAMQASGLSAAEYLQQSNRLTMVFAMIETAEALDNVAEIAAVPGLDGLFVGPSDLSINLSKGAGIDRTGAKLLAAMKIVAETARRHGLVAGAFGGDAGLIKSYLALGYTFIAAAVDVDLLHSGAEQLIRAVREV